jgi:hypothetical protein
MRWAEHVARIGAVYTGFWWGKLREGNHLEDPGIDGRIILRRVFRKWDVRACTGSIWRALGNAVMNLWVP